MSTTQGAAQGIAVTRILDGIRVVDLTAGLAGPVATMFLAEAGADVVKIETTEGDCTRGTAAFATWNRGKRSVVLDLDAPDDLKVLERLLREADVLVHSLGLHEAARLGLDEPSVAARHPDVIVCTIGGYPAGHPDEDRPGSDILVQARSGLMAEVFTRRPGPTFARVPLPSWGAAYLACSGILTKLLVRERYGVAGAVGTSLLQGALFFLNSVWKPATRPSVSLEQKFGIAKRPHPWMFVCSDDAWIQPFVTFVDAPPFVEAMAVLGLEPPVIEGEPTEADLEVYRQVFASRTADEWVQALWASDVDCEIMLHVGDVFSLDVARDAGATVELRDPVFGRVRQAAVPFDTDPSPRPTTAAPALDEHGAAIRHDGWGPDRPRRVRAPARSGRGSVPAHPLAGMRVLDLGVWISAPLCASLLGDLGAEVVKIESPAGDPSRAGGDIFFLAGNRAKRSIVVDLGRPEARGVLTELVRRSDVVVHNVRPSKARRLGFDHASLARIREDVVACEIAAYSDHGPYADVPGRDTLVGALSGWTLDGGDASTGPVWLRQMVGDTATSGAALIATLLGLYHRERTGNGSRVSASLLRTACAYSSETMLQLDDGTIAPFAASLPGAVGLSPGYRIYETADGWIAVATDGSALGRLCEELHVLPADLAGAVRTLRVVDALACCEQVGIAAEAVDADPERRFFSERANHDRGLVNVYEHPTFGTVSHPFGYWDLAPMACVGGVAAPLLGQHTASVLREVGCTERDVAVLTQE